MARFDDLKIIDYFSFDKSIPLRAVGWLEKESRFQKDMISKSVFKKLQSLREDLWQPFCYAGLHQCELCTYQFGDTAPCGTLNFFIPFKGYIYVAPELIIHYIDAHRYAPPKVFIEAVMEM